MSGWPEPDLIQAAGVAVAAVIAAWQAHTARKVRDLETRLDSVEAERDELKHLFRIAVQHIRDWLAWSREHHPGTQAPPLPDDLRDEV